MDITANDYCEASVERLAQARVLYDRAQSDGTESTCHALTIYVAGIAVECMLRSLIIRNGQDMDTGHDLRVLLTRSRLGVIANPAGIHTQAALDSFGVAREKLRKSVSTLLLLWRNQLRYVSEARMRRELQNVRQLRGIKGDPMKENARRAVDAAANIVQQGVLRWAN